MHLLANRLILSVLFALLLTACAPDPARDNPFDPAVSSSASESYIEGWGFSYYEPRRPLRNITVTLNPLGRFQVTGSGGRFRFDDVPAGEYLLVASRAGFVPDSLAVTLPEAGQISNQNLFLNALPSVRRVALFSNHIDEIFPGEFFQATVTITVSDSDGVGDISALRLEIPEVSLLKNFSPTSRPDSFTVSILDIELPQANLAPLVEIGCRVVLEDRAGARQVEGPFFLKRIIEETPLPLSPAAFDTTGPLLQLSWQRLHLPFDFTYEVEVFRLFGGVAVPVFSRVDIAPEVLSLAYPDSLADGQYYWTAGVRDQLNNFSRSEEARFIVLDGSD